MAKRSWLGPFTDLHLFLCLVRTTIIEIPPGLMCLANGCVGCRRERQPQERINGDYQQFCGEQDIGLEAT